MTACIVLDDPFRCPSKWELWRQILDLAPRGRAWQTHEQIYQLIDAAFDGLPTFALDVSSLGAEDEAAPQFGITLTYQQRYWAAFAEVLAYLHERACALLEEFFCATASEQLAELQIDLGFPDACEPYATLCQKVADDGGQTCADLVAIAAARGWSIACNGCVVDGGGHCTGIAVTVYTSASPAYAAPTTYPIAGLAVADLTSLCPPGLEGLQCLLDKVRPAHVPVIYEVV